MIQFVLHIEQFDNWAKFTIKNTEIVWKIIININVCNNHSKESWKFDMTHVFVKVLFETLIATTVSVLPMTVFIKKQSTQKIVSYNACFRTTSHLNILFYRIFYWTSRLKSPYSNILNENTLSIFPDCCWMPSVCYECFTSNLFLKQI